MIFRERDRSRLHLPESLTSLDLTTLVCAIGTPCSSLGSAPWSKPNKRILRLGVGCMKSMVRAGLPSGNQTWLAGKWTIKVNDFSSYKPPFSSRIFRPAMFDYQGVDINLDSDNPMANHRLYEICLEWSIVHLFILR